MDIKKWFKSKTIWSDILTIALALYGGAVLVAQNHGVTLPSIESPIFVTALGILGSLGIVGRVSATKAIGSGK